LTHYLSYFDYDPDRASDFMRDFGKQVVEGTVRLSDHVAGLADAATPAQKDEALVGALRDEGPNLLPAITHFLANPPPVDVNHA
jgi:hypothetical protein